MKNFLKLLAKNILPESISASAIVVLNEINPNLLNIVVEILIILLSIMLSVILDLLDKNFRNLLDINKDGKVNMEDVKCLVNKIVPKKEEAKEKVEFIDIPIEAPKVEQTVEEASKEAK